MKVYDKAKEYASREYLPTDKEFWLLVDGFLAGYECGQSGIVRGQTEIGRIAFQYRNNRLDFKLSKPVYTDDEAGFVRLMRSMFGARLVTIHRD